LWKHRHSASTTTQYQDIVFAAYACDLATASILLCGRSEAKLANRSQELFLAVTASIFEIFAREFILHVQILAVWALKHY
jgi:hypothetical protein